MRQEWKSTAALVFFVLVVGGLVGVVPIAWTTNKCKVTALPWGFAASCNQGWCWFILDEGIPYPLECGEYP